MNNQDNPIRIGVPIETFPGENRVALTPENVNTFQKEGVEVWIESGAGEKAGFPNSEYEKHQTKIVSTREKLFKNCNVILQVRGLGANPHEGEKDLEFIWKDQIIIGHLDPLNNPDPSKKLAEKGVTAFAMELMPRITRAQSMDTLSSMATIAGYKAVLLAANALHKMFPMMMTAAGTIAPAKVFVIGAGVAGLQAIATSKRLGAVVQAYDVRPAVKEQVESVGGKFVELELDPQETEDKGGYAKELDEEFYRKQREMMSRIMKEIDVVITTAAIPGKKAPILITKEMVAEMAPGSVILDLAAERGGNCELTQLGETVNENGVIIMGPENLASTIPYHASRMYGKNITTFLKHLIQEGQIKIDTEDEITQGTLVTYNGEVVNEQIQEIRS